MTLSLRTIRADEYPKLRHFLWLAIYLPTGAAPVEDGMLTQPELQRYIAGFGRPGDWGYFALHDREEIGAAWCRLFPASAPGYGYFNEQTPELSVAVEPDWRGQGVGERLMSALISCLQNKGYAQTSLSVSRENAVAGWYRRLGFATVSERADSLVMVRRLGNPGEAR